MQRGILPFFTPNTFTAMLTAMLIEAGGEDGTFLVRKGTKGADDYVLSVIYKGKPT